MYFADAKLKLGLLINTHSGFLRIEQNLEYVRKAQKLLKTSLWQEIWGKTGLEANPVPTKPNPCLRMSGDKILGTYLFG